MENNNNNDIAKGITICGSLNPFSIIIVCLYSVCI